MSCHGIAVTVTTALNAGRLLSSLAGALDAVDTVQQRRLPVRDLLATVLSADDVTAWEQNEYFDFF